MKRILLLCCAAFLFACKSSQKSTVLSFNPYNYTSQKKLVVSNGAVVSAHPIASKIGIDMLKKGGNAIDAAIATQLALAVVYPNAGNLGGGGFLVARLSNGELVSIDYREKAPRERTKARMDIWQVVYPVQFPGCLLPTSMQNFLSQH